MDYNINMEMIFLGTGPHQAIPRLGCRCPACADARRVGSKSRRRRSSLLIKSAGTNVLIDCGPDFLEQAALSGLKRVDAVFLTHRHRDAAGGLDLLDGWTKKPITVYTEEENIRILAARRFGRLNFTPIRPRQKIKINHLVIQPVKVEHGLVPIATLGFIIAHKIIYASDFGCLPPKTQSAISKKPLAIFDAALYFDRKMAGHLNTAESVAWAHKLKIKKLYLTQIGHSYPPYNLATREIKKFVKKYYPETSLKVVLAYDELKIKL